MAKQETSNLYNCLLLTFGAYVGAAACVNAQQPFPIEFGSNAMRADGPSLVTVTSWEDYKRIKLGKVPAASDGTAVDKPEAKPDQNKPSEATNKKPPVKQSLPTAAQPTAQTSKPVTQAPQAKPPKPAAALRPSKPKRRSVHPKPNPTLITAPAEPTQTGNTWAFYLGAMDVKSNPYYDSNGIDFQWAYSRKNPLPKDPRIAVVMHGSGGATGSMWVFGPTPAADIEARAQDAEGYDQFWRQWWMFGADGLNYPGRRIAAMLRFLTDRYGIDVSDRGIILDGSSMGGTGAVTQTMNLPDPWRENIAYSSGRMGTIMPREIAKRDSAQYGSLAPDSGSTKKYWDEIDFAIQSAVDPIVRGIHYRHTFSSDDQFSEGLDGNTQLEFVNLIEQHKIGGAFVWVKVGHGLGEPGVNLPNMTGFESSVQDVTLDRAHPAITQSTGNHPFLASDRINEKKYPRGHYNMGIIWDHASIVDSASQILFPLQYKARKGIGKGIPDQPQQITISVTPRRPRNFVLEDGEMLKWSWDKGALTGLATVVGDTVTIDSIPLVSGQPFKRLRIYR